MRRSRWSWSKVRWWPTRSRIVPCVFLAGLYRAERDIAERLLRLAEGRPPWPAIDPDKAIPWVEQKTGLILAASQREAVRLALRAKVLVITGGPGVGKTTLVNAILKILRAKNAEHCPRGADRPGRQAAARGHRPGGQDPAPAARGRPGSRRLQAPARSTRSTATCWSWTRSRWSTCPCCTPAQGRAATGGA